MGENKEQADRFNEGKVEWTEIDFKSIEPLVRVLMYGAKKYSSKNWTKGMPTTQIINSAMRHMVQLMNGEFLDEESGISHCGHVCANMMFLEYVVNNKPEFNDLNLNKNDNI